MKTSPKKTQPKTTPKTTISRRQFLALGAALGTAPAIGSPVKHVIQGLTAGMIRKAQAVGAVQPKNYVYLYLGGGFPRWYFDLLLKTAKNDPKYVQSNHVSTRFNGATPAYDTVTVNGPHGTYEFPSLWNSMIPTTNGGSVPMLSLASNMLSLRGVSMLGDGHPANAQKVLQPNKAGASLNGLVADASGRPIPAVSDSNTLTSAYHSNTGVGQLTYDRFSNDNFL